MDSQINPPKSNDSSFSFIDEEPPNPNVLMIKQLVIHPFTIDMKSIPHIIVADQHFESPKSFIQQLILSVRFYLRNTTDVNDSLHDAPRITDALSNSLTAIRNSIMGILSHLQPRVLRGNYISCIV
jgi:hypothetical protein